MKIFVISLKSSERRRANIGNQLRASRIDFEFFDAISGSEALNHVHHYDDAEFTLNCGRSATANEIGCYASHLALWARCQKSGEPFLILEDDAHLDPAFLHGIGVIERRIRQLDFVRITGPYPDFSKSFERSGPFDFRRCKRVPLLALGYAMSPKAAARLVTAGSIVAEPVDKFIQRFWRHKQVITAVHPPIVHASTLNAESEIGRRVRPGYTLGLWARRLFRKSTNSIMREVFNARLRLRKRVTNRARTAPSGLPESDARSL